MSDICFKIKKKITQRSDKFKFVAHIKYLCALGKVVGSSKEV